ncbi:MAG: topoisomerase DNA-binding C4 zinc finger domain-containing protein, partial [Rudaea sp.]
EKHSRRGAFYGCSRYPECKFAVSDRPLPEACPNCGGLLTVNAKGIVRCARGDYKRQEVQEAPVQQPAA